VHGFVLVEGLLDEGVAVAAEADEGLVQLVGFIGIKRELRLGKLELGIIVRGTGTVLAGGHLGLLGLDAGIECIKPLRNLQRLAGKRRGVLGGIAKCAGECLIDFAIGQAEGVLGILALLRHGSLGGQLAGKAERRLVYQAAGGRQGRGGVELERGIAAGDQVLTYDQCNEKQSQQPGQAEAAEVTESGEARLGELVHLSSQDGGTANGISLQKMGNWWKFLLIVMKWPFTGVKPMPH
jgi:hypothetical protein